MHAALLRRLAVVVVLLSLVFGTVSPVAAVATPCADLRIIAMSTDPYQPIQNQNATVHITIQNVGTCAAQAFVVQWQSDQFAPAGPSTSVANLNANATMVVDLVYAFPNSGNFMTIVNVDTGNAVNETNEMNNLEILPVSVEPATIDLQITDITVVSAVNPSSNPPVPVAGRPVTTTITIVNNGNTDAGPFQLQWYPWLMESPLATQVNALGAGATTTVTFSYTYWWAATFDGWATVDSGGWVFETDETNNTFAKSVVVDPALPDLVSTNFTINPAAPVPGQIATATVTVKNIGHADAGPFRVQWQPWWLVSPVSIQVNGLAEGASTNVTFNYVYWLPGKFDGTVTVDSTNLVWEMKEDNNAKPVTVTVGPNYIDLTITNMTISPGSPTQGQPATVNLTVKNLGNTPAGNFMVELNPDSLFLFTPGPQTISKQVNGLAAGATTTVSFQYTYPVSGNVRLLGNVDAFNNIAESNKFGPAENNNLKILNVTVQPAPIDLIITGFTINPASPVRGVEATASITVKNNGPWPANDFAVQWLLSNTDAFGPLEFINGLNPGESRTVTLKGTYYVTDTYTSRAIVDVFNTVVEPGPGAEANNTQDKTVTVVPQQATVTVTLVSLKILNSGDPPPPLSGPEGEWDPFIFAVLNPTATCNVLSQSIPGVECKTSSFDVEAGDTVSLGQSITVTLQEYTPLVIAAGALEQDLITPDFMGYVVKFAFPPDYLSLGTFTLNAEHGSNCGSNCFQATFTVTGTANYPTSAAMVSSTTLPPDVDATLSRFLDVINPTN